jgi:hypothetical protein
MNYCRCAGGCEAIAQRAHRLGRAGRLVLIGGDAMPFDFHRGIDLLGDLSASPFWPNELPPKARVQSVRYK